MTMDDKIQRMSEAHPRRPLDAREARNRAAQNSASVTRLRYRQARKGGRRQ